MRIKTAVMLIVFSYALAFHCRGAEEKVKLLFIAPTFSIHGIGVTMDGIKQIGEQLIKTVEKKTGLVFKYEMVGSPEDGINVALDKVVERLKKGGDFSWLDYPHYLEAQKQNVPVEPVALLTVGGKLTQKMCLYVKKDSHFKTIKDLRGTRITGGYLLDWVSLRTLLYDNKINERPDKFFGKLIPASSYLTSFSGVYGGHIDTFILSEAVYNVVKTYKPEFINIIPLVCTDAASVSLFPVHRKTVQPEVVKKFKQILYNAPLDPEMGMIAPILKSTGIVFVEATPDVMKKLHDSYNTMLKRGWVKEAEEYEAQFRSHERKKSELKKCERECKKKKDEHEQKICNDVCAQKYKP
ncbi:MAG: PhnD/SsuA/transferrin family substrate-binding protein [bacterium]